MKEPKHTPEWQNLLNDAADKFVTNHKDEEVRRMYGHHFRSFVEGAVWEFERNVNNFEKMSETILELVDIIRRANTDNYVSGHDFGKAMMAKKFIESIK